MQSAFVDHCLELLAPHGAVRARRMFGGHGLYVDDLCVAIIAYERLYLKTDAASAPRFEASACEPFVYDGKGKPMRMSYWSAPPEAMESPALMSPWARLAIESALRARALSTPGRARRTVGRASTKAAAPKPASPSPRGQAAKPRPR